MQTNITFRHLKSQHPELTEIAKETAENFNKFHDGIISADIEFMKDSTKDNNKKVQITVHIKGDTLVAHAESDEFGHSLNDCSDKIIRQLKKHKTKVLNHRTKAS